MDTSRRRVLLMAGLAGGAVAAERVAMGLGVVPQALDPMVMHIDERALRQHFDRVHAAIVQTMSAMPEHADYIERHVKAAPVPAHA